MSGNLQLFLRFSTVGINTVVGGVRQITGGFQGMGREVASLSRQMNNFSMASKAAFAYAGFNAGGFIKDAFKTNLDFHRDLLEMKQTGEMSAGQMASAKKHILEASGKLLQTPQDMLEGLRAFTTAGEKYEFALAAVDESARAATAFFSRPVEIANMDVDLKQKMGLRAEQLKLAHNMLLYHARSGRYETKAMSMDAPRTLNTMSQAGFTGIEGVNLMGALTQRLMRLAPTTQPAEVATYMEHFLAHLTQPHYVQGLMKKGIDIKKFMPGGKFGGVDATGKAIGGDAAVNDFLALLEEMKRKKLTDPFEMGKAGFREMYTSKAAMQSLQDIQPLRDALKEGVKSAKVDLVGAAFAEIREADFGKVKAAEIEVEKLKLGEAATAGTGGVAQLMKLVADNPREAAGLGVGAATAVLFGYKAWQGRKGGAGGMMGGAGGMMGGGALGAQQVFVTNWPAGMLGPGEAMRQKRGGREGANGGVVAGEAAKGAGRGANGGVVAGEAAKGAGRGARFKSGAMSGLKWGGAATLAFGAYDAYRINNNGDLDAGQKKDEYKKLAGSSAGSLIGGAAGGAIGALFGGFGAIPGALIGSTLGGMAGEYLATPEKSVMDGYQQTGDAIVESNRALAEAILNRPQQINVSIGSAELAGAVNGANARDARRN